MSERPAAVDVASAMGAVAEYWRPRTVAELNGQEVKLVKAKGEFIWHRHDGEDELFYVLRGRLRIEFRDGATTLEAGQMLVVPRGVEHRPVAEEEVEMLLFEPAGVRNTGDVYDPVLTSPSA